MSRSKSKLIGMYFRIIGEAGNLESVSEIIDQPAPGLFMTECHNLKTDDMEFITRAASFFDGVKFYSSSKEAFGDGDSLGVGNGGENER